MEGKSKNSPRAVSNDSSQQPTPTLRRPSHSLNIDSEAPEINSGNNYNGGINPLHNSNAAATSSNNRQTPNRWRLSTNFFSNTNPLFYNNDSENPNQLTDYDQQILTYLEGIQIKSYLPGWFCYFEKFVLLFDFFQLFGLLWITAQPWPWPYLWSVYTRPINGFNLDFFSLTSKGALAGKSANLISQWGQMEGYLSMYGIYFAAFAGVLAVLLHFLFYYKYYFNFYGIEFDKKIPYLFSIVLFFSYCFFLPANLAVFRIYYCDDYHDSSSVLPVDPTVNCLDSTHMMYLGIYTILIIPFTLSVFYYFYYFTSTNVIYYNAVDHEKKLQISELLYIFGLKEDFITRQLWIISSFRYFGRFYYFHMLCLKFSILLSFIFLRSNYPIQGCIIFLCLLLFSIYYCCYKLPFRSFLTNLQFFCISCLLILNISYGICNAFEMVNVMMTASTETIFLIAFHMALFCIILGVFCYIWFIKPIKLDWPSIRTLDRILHSPTLIPKVYHWLILLKQIESTKINYLLQPSEINDIQLLEFLIQQLRIYFLQAKSIGSIFESIIQDYLEELLWIHSQRAIFSLRKLSFWDNAYKDAIKNKLFIRQRQRYALMNPTKRRLLLKLMTYYLLRGGNRYQPKFDINVALEYQQTLRLQRELKLQRLKEIYHQKQLNKQGNTFSNFQSDFQSLMNDMDEQQGEGKTPGKSEIVYDNDYYEEIDKFDPDIIEEAKKMISRLQQRTELALNKHSSAAKSITEQQTMANRSQMIFQENSKNQTINNIIHQYNLSHQQAGGGGAGGGASSANGSMLNLQKRAPFGSNNSMMSSAVGGGKGLNKITTMELMKETVDEEERQDLEELYYLWDEAIALYESEEFPGDYDELNMQVENWYAYRGLVSQRLEVIVKFLQEQLDILEQLDELADEQVIEEDDDEDDHIEKDFDENEYTEKDSLLTDSQMNLYSYMNKPNGAAANKPRRTGISTENNSNLSNHAYNQFTNSGNSSFSQQKKNRNALSRHHQQQPFSSDNSMGSANNSYATGLVGRSNAGGNGFGRNFDDDEDLENNFREIDEEEEVDYGNSDRRKKK
jgi:hypothetical protein